MNPNALPADNIAPAASHGWRWAPAWVLAFVALWPAPGIAEGVMVLGALAAIARLLLVRFRGGMRLLSGPAWALTSALFMAYWTPQLISAFDASDASRAFYKVGTGLRYLPFLWLVAAAVANEKGRRTTFGGLAIIVTAWTVDALLQVVFGTSPLFWGLDQLKQLVSGHGMCSAEDTLALDRLSGFLGPCNLKLGVVLASLSPFALFALGKRFGMLGWVLASAAIGLVILLAGARAAWLTYGLVLVFSGWRLLGWKKLLAVFAFGALSLVVLNLVSPQFRERIERTTQALAA
ncbi:MAG TPA: O-antigen ligase family protein, partial [Pseudoxanthomonas sp.]|nr:O-antigen ligase family protein [Pseudoxanthomonas sp.]